MTRHAKPTTLPHQQAASLLPSAAEIRLGLVVGNNTGSGQRPPLRFAERDAKKVADVLRQLGHFDPNLLLLLQAGGLSGVRDSLARLTDAISKFKARQPSSRATLLFYYSGHSDGEALELGTDRLAFSELRAALQATGADVRIGIIDSCRSGSIISGSDANQSDIQVKGGKPGPGFDVSLLGMPALYGEVFLSSSRADELSLESRELGGSFFTHHLVSGLRGAADVDGDSQVSLEELYRHTADRTSSAAANTLYGSQTPAYDYRLVGHGDLMLSDLRQGTHYVYVPGGFDRVLILEAEAELVAAESQVTTGQLIALPPGKYTLRGQRDGRWFRSSAEVQSDLSHFARTLDFVPEDKPESPDSPSLGEMARDFRPGNTFAEPLPKSNPYFCEGTEGNWKACRDGGCHVCAEMVEGFPHYFRNHPNCIPSLTCKGRYFSCSANCPPPTAEDSCDPEPNGWEGCYYGCAVCVPEIAEYPRYFENHPNCIPMPGRCKAAPTRCGAACPAPGPEDR